MGILTAGFTEEQNAKFDELQKRADFVLEKYESFLLNPKTPEEHALILALSDQVISLCNKIIDLVQESGERLKTGNV